MTQTGTMQQPESLSLLAWYTSAGWARRRARRNVARRRTPAVIVAHPEHGYAAVSMASLSKYAAQGCEVVEEVHPHA